MRKGKGNPDKREEVAKGAKGEIKAKGAKIT